MKEVQSLEILRVDNGFRVVSYDKEQCVDLVIEDKDDALLSVEELLAVVIGYFGLDAESNGELIDVVRMPTIPKNTN